MYNAIDIKIENSEIIETALFERVRSQKPFIESRDVFDARSIEGWHFPRVYLTHGSWINGSGFAFIKD